MCFLNSFAVIFKFVSVGLWVMCYMEGCLLCSGFEVSVVMMKTSRMLDCTGTQNSVLVD